MPRELPILFSDPMVRAILDGRKTQTRRPVKPGGDWYVDETDDGRTWPYFQPYVYAEQLPVDVPCPYGSPGDTLWVREAWRIWDAPEADIQYRADEKIVRYLDSPSSFWRSVRRSSEWRPSIYMPKWASRIRLRVTEVRVERVQEISAEDAVAEGATIPRCSCEVCTMASSMCTADKSEAILEFASLWNSINAKRGLGWDANPWVWVVSFERIAP